MLSSAKTKQEKIMTKKATLPDAATKASKVLDKKEARKLRAVKSLSKAEFAKLKMEDLWVLEPSKSKAKAMSRLCGCQSVCLA
jgi:hypothetical protein